MSSPFYRKQALALKALQIESRDLRKKVMTALPRAQARLIEAELARVAASGLPIIAGPFVTEPGIELMFWIPFLRWFLETFDVAPERVLVMSRGGVDGWYADVAGRYVDAFDFMTLEEIQGRELYQKDEKQKPVEILPWEQSLVERVAAISGWTRFEWIHPAMLFNFTRIIYNAGPEGDRLLLSMTRHRIMEFPPPAGVSLDGIPDEFVAMRFYTQATKGALWDEPRTATAVREYIRLLSDRMDVVDLDPGMRFTDHTIPKWDFAYAANDRIWELKGRIDLRKNLGTQAWLISRSKAFTGTLGGFSCIASLSGVPALTFTALDGYPFLTPYRRYSLLIFQQLGVKYAISNPLHADLARLVDAFGQGPGRDLAGTAPFPWPVGPAARADGGSSHPDDAACARVRIPDERWVLRKRIRAKRRNRLRERAKAKSGANPTDVN